MEYLTFDDQGRSPEFLAFAKAQDPEQEVMMLNCGSCALARFLKAQGVKAPRVDFGYYDVDYVRKPLPRVFEHRLYGIPFDAEVSTILGWPYYSPWLDGVTTTWADIVARMEA